MLYNFVYLYKSKKKKIMKTIKITMPMLASLILSTKKLPSILEDAFDTEELEQGDYTSILQYFTETQNWDLLTNNEFSWQHETETACIEWSENGAIDCKVIFLQTNTFSDWVQRSYEEALFPWENDAWKMGYCSSDDDVNYNGSYLDVMVALLELYLVTNKYTIAEHTTYID